MEISEKIPTNQILVNVQTPTGEPVRIIPVNKYMQLHRTGFSSAEGRFCCIMNNEVRTSIHYDYNEVIPVTMPDYTPSVKKCRP